MSPSAPPPPRGAFRFLGNAFLTGLLAILPLYLTALAVRALFHLVDEPTGVLIQRFTGWRIVGAGALATLLIVLAIGLVVSRIGLGRFGAAIESVFRRVPGIGRLYSTIRSLLDPLSHPESRPFRDAVWVDVGNGMRLMGFVTSGRFVDAAGEAERVNVYLPMSHPYVGFVVTIEPDRLRPCPAPFEEVISYHFSCGSALPKEYRPS